jgi:phospholipid/cholesterol/gamma-HCH transport system substrate-binding protein
MKRLAAIAAAVIAATTLIAASASGDDGLEDGYLIRAYFDNAGFLVDGEEVRIAGATIGTVEEVDIARVGEVVSEDGSESPGKAVAVFRIDDEGYQDFRSDATCLIRPQSLLGEKYVDCEPTQPRAPGSEAAPPLEIIPEGEIGEGQHRLPLENNGKAVDLDLVNNIYREPYIDRFRIILNELGAGFAARGEDLGEVIERANPALQETDRVLEILADQNEGLAQLTADSDTILAALARERDSVAGFINNAAIAGQAAAERRDDIAEGFRRFPPALEELEKTMVELRGFAEAATPVASDLGDAAPSLAGATRALRPFSLAGTTALTSLGDAAEASGDDLAASEPVLKQLRRVGEATTPGAKSLAKLLRSLRKTGGIDYLMAFVLNASNTFNGFDDFGHFLRASLEINNCSDYEIAAGTGCIANWADATTASTSAPATPESVLDAPYPDPTFGSDAEGSADTGGVEPEEESSKGGDNGGIEFGESADSTADATSDLLGFLMEDDR